MSTLSRHQSTARRRARGLQSVSRRDVQPSVLSPVASPPEFPQAQPAGGLYAGLDSELAKATSDFVEQVGAGGLDNTDILELVAKAVSPLTQRSNPSRVLQAVYASITLEEFLTLKMRFEDRMTIEEIAQRQGRPVETVQAEIARSCTRIRVYQVTDSTGQ